LEPDEPRDHVHRVALDPFDEELARQQRAVQHSLREDVARHLRILSHDRP
jgi:hypothetical protein